MKSSVLMRVVCLTAVVIFTAEGLIMLFIESFDHAWPLPLKILFDAFLLILFVSPTLYLLLFREMNERIARNAMTEQATSSRHLTLEATVQERTVALQKVNDELMAEIQERARVSLELAQALRETSTVRQHLLDVIDAVRDALVVVDEERCVLTANQAAEQMLGRDLASLRGSSLFNLLADWSSSDEALQCFLDCSQERAEQFLLPPSDSDGPCHPVQMRCGARLDWEGRAAIVLLFYYRVDLQASDVNRGG